MFVHDHDPADFPGLPLLVSFPRTGSHWLRVFLERWFDRPLMTRSFFEHASSDYLLSHTHALDDAFDAVARERPVVYLHRSVLPTVFSELTYRHGEAGCDQAWAEVAGVADAYREHLAKWLGADAPAADRCVVAYEQLLDEPMPALDRVVRFLGGSLDESGAEQMWASCTHDLVAERTTHDPRVVARDRDLQQRRDVFRYRFGRRILERFETDRRLNGVLDPRLIA
jgi:hypothetical protein